ncbi:hypothetical protein MTO96_023897, partial [Rhipicephalus appendiculatus]
MFGPPAFATLGPPSLPDGVKGGLIHVSGSTLQQNGGSMRLMSPTVGLQMEASCVSVWYYMFGARRLSLQLSLSKTSPSSGFVHRESVLLRHRGRTTMDKWYNVQRSVNLDTPHNQAEVLASDVSKVVWTMPAYTGRNWMLARVDIVQDDTFQVAFRANFSASQALESFSIDEVALRPDACYHPAECDFADGLCGYVNKVDGCFRWLVGTGRLENPRLHRGVRVPQDIAAANVSVHCYNDNVSVKIEAMPSFELDEASDWATANLTLVQGTHCQLQIEVIRGSGTNGTMAIASIKVTKSDP